MTESAYLFDPDRYADDLRDLIHELDRAPELDKVSYERILRRHPKDGKGFFSKSEIIRGFRHLNVSLAWHRDEEGFIERIRMKPIRTASGVAPVTVLTKPWPCPGRCIFCPSDVRMPKSYLSDEPGAQRAAQHRFDPFGQTLSRLKSDHNTGHKVDKVELIILGGTWSSYPEAYQIWFVLRCFEAMNAFDAWRSGRRIAWTDAGIDFDLLEERVDGRTEAPSYNRVVERFVRSQNDGREASEVADWDQLAEIQRVNERAAARCVGLVVETRPDHLTSDEVIRIRRLGATKVQIGLQSLSDEVLRLNHRGHDVAASRRAMTMLRQVGLKLHAHWMPNLYGSTPAADVADFELLFEDPALRPDELKIYPCSLIESAELMSYHDDGRWRPYDHEELLEVLTRCLARTPGYCRLTRVIRDIPGTDIVAGNRLTNFRELAERALEDRGVELSEIRAREIRHQRVDPDEIELTTLDYDTTVGREVFLQWVTPENRLAAFLRLSLPSNPVPLAEIATAAMIREVHVYGHLASIGERGDVRSQHLGLGRSLIEEAARLACQRGFTSLAVISSVGTREYYRSLGFTDGELYQHLDLSRDAPAPGQKRRGPN